MKKFSSELIELNDFRKYNNISSKMRNKWLKNLLYNETKFLQYDAPPCDRLYYIEHNLFEQVKCPVCYKPTKLLYKNKEYHIKCCSVSCSKNKINPKTGLTIAQFAMIKTKQKQSIVDPETGLTGYQKNGIKIKQRHCMVDPETGLTGYQKNGIKTKQKQSMVDPETGLTGYQKNGIKSKIGNLRVNPETGLNGYQSGVLKTKQKQSMVDPETGLTGYQKNGIKIKRKHNMVDPETGLTGYQKNGIKTKQKQSMVDPETGLTGYQKNGIKSKIGNLRVNSETGLNGYQSGVLKTKQKQSMVDPETGLTGYQKNGISRKKKNYLNLLVYFCTKYTEYTLSTTEKEYITLEDYRTIRYIHNKCGTTIQSLHPSIRCTKCYPYNKSIGENEVLEYCQSLTTNIQSNTRSIISPLELDIYIPDHNLAIEYNGLFWHSSYSIETEEPNYHLMKTQECEKQGIQLFHIFENEWQDPIKQNIWKSIIKNQLGHSERIFARKTILKPVSSKEKIEFLNCNHLQGDCKSSVNLGLYLGDELVSLMTVGRSRYDKKVEWELIRFCNRVGCSVVGGASKLLKAFRSDNSGSIISYADKRRSGGNLYKQLGFEFSHESSPNYFYWKDFMVLESRLKYQKHKLKDVLDIFDSKLTESENMYSNGYRKIYDCGNQVWIFD